VDVVSRRHPRHRPLWMFAGLLIIWAASCSCSFIQWEGPRYKPKYQPGGEMLDPTKLHVTIRPYPPVLLRPDRVALQLLIRGELEAAGCASLEWDIAGMDRSTQGCVQAERRLYFLKCWGQCTVRVRVLDEAGRQVAAGHTVISVGHTEEE
jgi:hypothetical protein